ncbi:exosome complex component MTR3 [Fopius arisanus]|uniref:Exosc6 protein n=1 Tax=Fopius arisanus TaxID=64838 RepID=A0A0C9RAN9_9HYME|nr:PREDICTED: exosome complex component MTR3 [Fopius arisanus]
MPVDQRRINGPEVTVPYQLYIDKSSNTAEQQLDLLNKREDGRAHDDIRKMFMKTGLISQAKGSAYIEIGTTKVVCSVFDPREIPNKMGYSVQGNLYCEFKFASFSCKKRKIHQQDSQEKEYSLIMQRALEPAVCRHEFPNFQVDIYALVLDNGGSCLAAAITAASLALANASIPMFGLVTAVSAGIYSDTVFLDTTTEEEALCSTAPTKNHKSKNHGIIMQAYLPQHDQVAELYFVGDIDISAIAPVLETLTEASKNISLIAQQRLVKSVMKTLKEREKEKEHRIKTEIN